MNLENNQLDPFVIKIDQLTKLKLTPEMLTKDLAGYKIQSFKEGNRNHFDDRPNGPLTPIKILVMHYTAVNLQDTLDIFTKDIPNNRASATYVVTEADQKCNIPGGKVIQVTPEEKRAWHAGVSQWHSMSDLNGISLGIEHVNQGPTEFDDHERKWAEFDPAQIDASGLLSQAIVQKYNISPVDVVGHQDIASDRKEDPGVLFPWGKLYADYGVGAWLTEEEQTVAGIQTYAPSEPLPQEVSIVFLSRYLKTYGYNVEETDFVTPQFSAVLKAFKAHFSQNQNPPGYDDNPDMKDMLWIWGLTAKYKMYL